MKDRPRCSGVPRGVFPTLAVLAIAGCGDEPAAKIVIVPGPSAATAAEPLVPTPVPAKAMGPGKNAAPATDFSQDRIEQGVTPPPAARPGPFLVDNVTRDFADPPLPPELNDDGGLKPLPTHRR